MIENQIAYNCDYCGAPNSERASHYYAKKRHFCNRTCYSNYRRYILPPDEQNAWQGGIAPEESRRRWREANKEKLKAMNKARLLREVNAPGHHTHEQWLEVIAAQNGCCADPECGRPRKLTKDHIVPLIMGGSDDIENIQGLCRPCNSRKGRKVYIDALPNVRADK